MRLDWQQADAAILCDPVAAVAPDSLGALRRGHTQVTVNTYVAPVSEFTRNPDAAMRPEALLAKIRHAAGDANTAAIDAHEAALALFGDSILSNMFMLGYAWQRGGVPLSQAAINRAIELNGVAVAANRAAFDSGRLAAHRPDALESALRPRAQVVQLHVPETFARAVARRIEDLTSYQDAAYARKYQDVVEAVAARERELAPDAKTPRLAMAVARSLFKLMAYKDEYEVARLYTGESFQAQLKGQFEGDYSLRFHMAPPVFARKDPRTGVPRKMTLGPRTMTALKVLTRLKGLRGTWFDPFGHTAERKMERSLVQEYRQTIDHLLAGLTQDKLAQAATIAALAETIRGFGHVKAANVEKYRTELGRLMQSYTAPAPRDMPLRKTA
ncbi:2-oxoacid ferredoxin oxidoreductase [compost metagenome]